MVLIINNRRRLDEIKCFPNGLDGDAAIEGVKEIVGID